MREHASAKETVGGIRAETLYALFNGLLNRWSNGLLLFVSHHAVVAVMRVQSEHSDARCGNQEIVLQALVELVDFLCHVFLRDGNGHFADWQMRRHQCHAHHVVGENHERFVALSDSVGQIFSVSGKIEVRALNGVFADWGSDQNVDFPVLQRFCRRFECPVGSASGLLAGASKFHVHVVVKAVDEVEASVNGVLRRVDKMKLRFDAERFSVVAADFRRTENNWRTHFKHRLFGKSLENDFIAHAVSVAVSDANAEQSRLFVGRCIFFLRRVVAAHIKVCHKYMGIGLSVLSFRLILGG